MLSLFPEDTSQDLPSLLYALSFLLWVFVLFGLERYWVHWEDSEAFVLCCLRSLLFSAEVWCGYQNLDEVQVYTESAGILRQPLCLLTVRNFLHWGPKSVQVLNHLFAFYALNSSLALSVWSNHQPHLRSLTCQKWHPDVPPCPVNESEETSHAIDFFSCIIYILFTKKKKSHVDNAIGFQAV